MWLATSKLTAGGSVSRDVFVEFVDAICARLELEPYLAELLHGGGGGRGKGGQEGFAPLAALEALLDSSRGAVPQRLRRCWHTCLTIDSPTVAAAICAGGAATAAGKRLVSAARGRPCATSAAHRRCPAG